MKKLLYVLLLTAGFACSKNKTCYECEMVKIDGTHYKESPCTDDLDAWMQAQKDNNGNAVQGQCTEK